MKKYKIDNSNSEEKSFSDELLYKYKNYEGKKIKLPEFKFTPPKAKKIESEISKGIEGKWKGMIFLRNSTFAETNFNPFNPNTDYDLLFKKINFNAKNLQFGGINYFTPIILRKWGLFDNKSVIAYEDLWTCHIELDIIKRKDEGYDIIAKRFVKKIQIQLYHANYESNNRVLDYMLPIGEEKQISINENMKDLEITDHDSREGGAHLSVEGEFLNLEQKGPKEKEIFGSTNTNCWIDYKNSRVNYTLQQLSNNRLICYGSFFEDAIINWDTFSFEKNTSSCEPFNLIMEREKVEEKTHITVGGDYVEKKVDIKDSVINRSEI
jgi:hypothetical protein|tara:strand:+ start:3479 stop:4447 length:969 start_codon:yes stop_codon:yes gene_type:complete